MRAVIQRVRRASVEIDGKIHAEISRGMLVLLGVLRNDTPEDAQSLGEKIARLRFFEDAQGKMNLAAADIAGEALVVSQFTLAANCTKGRRPSFDSAAPPDEAGKLYELFADTLRKTGITVRTGIFQAKMLVRIENDGPVTFVIDTR